MVCCRILDCYIAIVFPFSHQLWVTQENSLGKTWHDHGLLVQYLLTPYHDSRLEFQNHSNPKVVKIKNLSNWFVLLVRRTLHVSQLLLHRVCQVSAKMYEHGHVSHGGHCRCVKGCQVHTLLFFQQQPYFQIGGTLFSGLQHFPLTHNA